MTAILHKAEYILLILCSAGLVFLVRVLKKKKD